MDCQVVRERIGDFVDGSLDRPVRDQIMDHLSGCAECSAQVRTYQVLVNRLESLPLETAPAGARAAVMAALKREPGVRGTSFVSRLMGVLAPRPLAAMAAVAALVLVALFAGSGSDGPRVAGAPLDVRLVVASGVAVVNGSEAAVPRSGLVMHDRDLLVTPSGFQGQLVWSDGTKVRVDPGSSVIVHAETLELQVGKLWLQVAKRSGGTFAVETPMAVAAVKGTSFDVIHRERLGSLVKVYEGLVGVSDRDAGGPAVDVAPGRYAMVTMDAPLRVGDFSDDGSVVNDLRPFFRADE